MGLKSYAVSPFSLQTPQPPGFVRTLGIVLIYKGKNGLSVFLSLVPQRTTGVVNGAARRLGLVGGHSPGWLTLRAAFER